MEASLDGSLNSIGLFPSRAWWGGNGKGTIHILEGPGLSGRPLASIIEFWEQGGRKKWPLLLSPATVSHVSEPEQEVIP